MRDSIKFLLVVTMSALWAVASATDPPAPPAASSTSTPATTTSDKPTDTKTTATTSDRSTDAKTTATTSDGKVKLVAGDEAADKQMKRLKAAGYKPEIRGGEVVFCRKEALLGSRFEKKTCGTAEALEQQTSTAQEMAAQAQRNSNLVPQGK